MRPKPRLRSLSPALLALSFGCTAEVPADRETDARALTLDLPQTHQQGTAAARGPVTVEIGRFEAHYNALTRELAFETFPTPVASLGSLRASEQALYCPVSVGARASMIRMNTVPTSVGTTPTACGLPDAMPYTTLGVICADVVLTAVDTDFGEVFAEVTRMNPSIGYSGYNHPFGTGIAPEHMPVGSTAPSDQAGGLWRYEDVVAGVPNETQWVFENAGGAFSYSGRLVARVFETADGIDNDCDGVIDNGLNLFEGGHACEFNNDCVSSVCIEDVCQTGQCAIDSDSDGTFDCFDDCPEDPAKAEPGACGCNVPDDDADLDGTADCIDACPEDPAKVDVGVCGCNVSDTDSDLDGTADCIDACPEDPAKTDPGACGCGLPETCSLCGNGIVEAGEDCDTGGETATCDDDCSFVDCGDGVTNVTAGEDCDTGGDSDTCDNNCTPAQCGDGTLNTAAGEFCDDGNTNNNDACANTCTTNSCGDGIVQLGAGEACDDGNSNNDDGCSNTCQTGCGDGAVAGGAVTSFAVVMHVDAIQDGSQFSVLIDDYVALSTPLQDTPVNTIDGVAPIRTFDITDPVALAMLSSGPRMITIRMGAWVFGNSAFYVDWLQLVINGSAVTLYDANGAAGGTNQFYTYDVSNFVEVLRYRHRSEACDDGNTEDGDGCSSECLVEGCGNGRIDAGEQCDDGNTNDSDGCSRVCELENCGDGGLDPYEDCDDNNGNDADGCTAFCKIPRCGNGIQETGELCDDANTRSGDGCSSACMTETCGNGVVDIGESCDGGSGCTLSCAYASCLAGTDSDSDGLDDCVETNTGVFVSLTNTGTDPFDADTDDDALPDGVEVLTQANGLNLRTLGANPLRKTIFVEADWTNAPTCADLADFQPADWEMDIARQVFAEAPVTNRDGSTGIDLIVDYGQGGAFTGGNNLGSDSNLEGGLAGDFLVYKANNLASERAPYFRYAILTATQNNGAGGLGETPGNDFNVTQGCLGPSVARVGAFIHELGHNLGLLHGGDDACNFEPNYNSTMNYASTGRDTNCDGIDDALPDFSSGTHLDINEASINEFAGLCGSVPVDFDANSTIESGYTANLNPHTNEAAFCGGTISVLDDHDDWGNLFFGGLSTSGDSGVTPSIVICPPARPAAPSPL